jgi:hypothetical protein
VEQQVATESQRAGQAKPRPTSREAGATSNVSADDQIKLSQEVSAVKNALVERGLADKQALRLTAGQGGLTLDRMMAIVRYFDSLVEKQSPLIRKSPTGFLYRAVERPFDFVLPGERRQKPVNAEQTVGAKSSASSLRLEELATGKKINLEVAYLTERKHRLDTVLENTSAERRATLSKEVERALEKLKAHISPQRFVEAVQHGVEQRLLDGDGFPDFDAWIRERE